MVFKHRRASGGCRFVARIHSVLLGLFLAIVAGPAAIAAPWIKIEPASPSVESCLAFGAGPGGIGEGSPGFDGTSPYMGFIYQNVPPFNLEVGNILAFDLGLENDFDVEIDIAMAATTVNGGEIEAEPFTTVVTNSQTPANPRGDEIIGNFEMKFIAEQPFAFPGGGLIIRFSNASEAYRQDLTCNESQVGVVATSTDPSGNFVRAFWSDDDGVSPWEPDSATVALTQQIIGGFNISGITLRNTVVDATGTEITMAESGDVITYEVIVTNTSSLDATGVVVTDTLSDEVSFLQADAIPSAATVVDAGPPQTVTWSVGSLPAGESKILEIDARVLLRAEGKVVTNDALFASVNLPFEAGLEKQSTIAVLSFPDDIFGQNDGGNCFVATAAYGSYLDPEVRVLRRFRDKYLLTHDAGRVFVDWYYRNSPAAAAVIRDHEWMRVLVRMTLSPIVYALKYPIGAPLLFSGLLMVIFVSRRKMHRGHA